MIPLRTKFSENITADKILPEYPRPSLVREAWVNLNGLWEYAITDNAEAPEHFDGTILVPFSPETALSGVERTLRPGEYLWYRRVLPFACPTEGERMREGTRTLLHFGAADQIADVYVDGKRVAHHVGGYLPFTADITEALGDRSVLTVRIQDGTASSWHARGKQSLNPGGMFYTAQSGLWQTVWAETVPEHYVKRWTFTPDYDQAQERIRIGTNQPMDYTGTISAPDMEPIRFSGRTDEELVLDLSGQRFHPWSPEDPFLYEIELQAGEDCISGYFALRKCDIQTAPDGMRRFFLNGKPYFQAGVLDQGYWPESLYTAPTDEALIADITRMKELGFNLLRKHAKIEPERFYYHCDRLGMLVWQDMVNGGTAYRHWFVTYLATLMNWHHISFPDGAASRRLLSRMDKEGRREYLREADETVRFLYNHPSIVVWVPFNEGWGQFNAAAVAARIRRLDPTRLIDHASGWFDQGGGDIASLHYYFFTLNFKTERKRALALTEYGGYSMQIPGHSACPKEYGYRKFKTTGELTAAYERLHREIILPAVRRGIGATIYTQLSDIEEETNGLYTYDRAVCKLNPDAVCRWNRKLRAAGEAKRRKG